MIKQLFLLVSVLVVFTLAQLPRTYPIEEVANKALLERGLTKENLEKLNKYFRQMDYDMAMAQVDEQRTGKKDNLDAVFKKYKKLEEEFWNSIDDKQADIFTDYMFQFH